MTEYWLQKKTIGGWSMVTWYSELEQAMLNYSKCVGKGDSGYSWRLIEAKTIAEDMLAEVTNVETPELEQKTTSWGATIKPKLVNNGWGNPTPKPVASRWGSDSEIKEHGMVGKVWMLNHKLKERARVNPDEVESRKANGWIIGGPKTMFEG